jgi:hypothetical protein
VNFDGFSPIPFARFGGFADSESPDILPMGIASVARNCRFQLTSVGSRYGIQTAMSSPNKVPITGLASLIYTPENLGEILYQSPMLFDADGGLFVESPVGSGRIVQITGAIVTPPAGASAQITQAYNRAFIAYSDLKNSVAPMNVFSLASTTALPTFLEPYGQLPLGWNWVKNTAVIVNNYGQPSLAAFPGGNGHLYQCIQAGTTGATEPNWPLGEGSTVQDGTVVWQENTPVLVNRLPAPNPPSITRNSGGGAFAAGRDVYLVLTFVNQQGESIPSAPAILVDTAANDAVAASIPSLASLAGWIRGLAGQYVPTGVNVYEADVPTGTGAPSSASYALVGEIVLGGTAIVTSTATGTEPPTANTARVTPGGLQSPPQPTVERASGAGTFPAGRDVYVIATFTNSRGETLPGPAGILTDTVLDDAVQVPIASTTFQITGVNLYEADVPTGSAAPATTSYALVGSFQPGATATISASATGAPPPTTNTSGPPGSIAPDSPNLDDLGTQGLRYVSIAFTNRNGQLGGTVPAFTSIFVDVPGYELFMANIPIGPENIINRTLGFTIADSTNVGPFFFIPSATVSAQVFQTATVIPDNTTTTAFFNFTDTFLQAETSTDMTDRLRVIQPPPAVDAYYSPSIDRIILSGVDGYGSGHYISLAADSESYYGDTSPIQVANGNGQLCICAREFQGTVYSLKERSGFVITPTATDPSTWNVSQRWEGIGPCGPRAVAVCTKFMLFVHRSGVYMYTTSLPMPMLISTEMPNIPTGFWATINWDAQKTIWATIDEDQRWARIGLPVNGATTPNVLLFLDYSEGEEGPIKFTAQDGTEKYVPGARKWSIHDIQANVCVKAERQLQPNASQFAIQRQTQVLFGSSAPDGTVQMEAMGIYNDNGSGIDCRYETACPPANGVSQLGGVVIDARGNIAMKVAVIASASTTDADGISTRVDTVIQLPDMKLKAQQKGTYAQGARGSNEFFRLQFKNGAVPDAYFQIDLCTLYLRPLFSARTSGGR